MQTKTLSQIIQNEVFETIKTFQIKPEVITNEDINYNALSELGFPNISNLKNIKSKRNVEEYNEYVAEYNNLILTNRRLITFKDLFSVLEKYDLYMGSTYLYKNEIPEKNAKDIIDYDKIKSKFTKCVYNDILKVPFTSTSDTLYSNNNNINNYLICASLNNFDMTNCHIVGRQIFRNELLNTKLVMPKIVPNPDPIILYPMVTNNALFNSKRYLDIVTAWDREALDEKIFDKLLN